MEKTMNSIGEVDNDDNDNNDNGIVTPLDMSHEDYVDLVSQVKELAIEEAQDEWMESCRYGEIDVVRALLENFTPFSLVEFIHPQTGNTGLHMASANGHTDVVKLLVQHEHAFIGNSSGNTPLHWAAANGQASTVEFWTSQSTVEIDVLQKNNFGRSALTEGFTSEKEDVVKVLLEHDSATEEKLLSTSEKNNQQKDDSNESQLAQHVHYFFDKDQPLKIRELAMKNADNPFADTEAPEADTTGLSIWSASLVMARWMKSKTESKLWSDTCILELGSGCGVPGLMVAASSTTTTRPRTMFLTDLNPQTVENLQHNIELNDVQHFVSASCMDWSNTSTWPKEKVDYVIGSDLIYIKSLVPLLTSVIFGTLKKGGKFFYVCPVTGRDGLDNFVETMKSKCPGWSEIQAPKDYYVNPLTNDDDEECFLHFQELSSLTYMLYEFPIPDEII